MVKTHSFKLITGIIIFLFITCFPTHIDSLEAQKQEPHPLFTVLDLYCSFFIQEDALPELKISGAERESEKILFTDGDVVYINGGLNEGLSEGQVFLALEAGENIKKYGHLMFMKGRVRIVITEEYSAIGKVERACGAVRIGNVLVPFREKEGLIGQDMGYNIHLSDDDSISGGFLYMENENVQIGRGHRAIISLGSRDGLGLGQQVLIIRRSNENSPLQTIGNSVIIDIQNHSATIKILSSRDAITMKDRVRPHPRYP
jgi:hypothetical protein